MVLCVVLWEIPELNIVKRRLENSLRIVVYNRNFLTVAFRMLSAYGYRNEDFPEAIHLLEHMLFKPEEKVFTVFQKIGGDINGYVGIDEFGIHWIVPKVFQEKAIEAVRDILTENRRYWTETMLEREKHIILGETREKFSNPRTYVNILLRKKLFGENTPGTHPPEVIEKAFRNATLDTIRREAENISPEISVLAGVGNVDFEKLEHLNTWHGRPSKIKNLKPEPDYGVHFVEKDVQENFIALGWISAPKSSVDSEILSLLGAIMTAFPMSRLYRRLRLELGLVYYVGAANMGFVDTGYFTINTSTVPQKTQYVIEIIRSEITEIIDNGVSMEEIEDMKNLFFGSLYNITDSKIALSSMIAYNELFYGDALKTYRETAVMVSKLKPEDIQRVAKRYLTPEKSVICIVGRKI